jgi:hypothetical protein
MIGARWARTASYLNRWHNLLKTRPVARMVRYDNLSSCIRISGKMSRSRSDENDGRARRASRLSYCDQVSQAISSEIVLEKLIDNHDVYVITDDIYTKEDQLILTRAEALPPERIMGVETGGCPHTAIREDASMNLAAIDDMNRKFPHAELCSSSPGARTWPQPSAPSWPT